MISFPCQTEDSPIGPVTRVYAPVRIKTQPPKPEPGDTPDDSTDEPTEPAPKPEWISFEFLVNPGFDITIIPRQVGETLLLRAEPGDSRATLTWRGSPVKVILKTVKMEIEVGKSFRAAIAWAMEDDDIPLVLGQ